MDKTIRHTKQSVGTIKRLSAAVVINHRKDAKGLVKPLSDTELKQINELVKEALGYNKERGDTVSVANAPFSTTDQADSEIPLWKDPELLYILKSLFKYGAIAAIVAYLLFKVVLPLGKAMLEAPPRHPRGPIGGNINMLSNEGEDDNLPPSAAEALSKKLDEARDLAQQDPKVIANIIKDWTGSNGG